MANLIKEKVASMVKEAIKARMSDVHLEWPDHSIIFLGHVAAGESRIQVNDVGDYETMIKVQTQYGPRYFHVKVTERY